MFVTSRQNPLINPWFSFVLVLLLLLMPTTGSALMGAPSPWLRELCDGDSGETPVGQAQIIRFGMTSAAYQSLLDVFAPRGYEAVWVDGYNVGSNVFFNAILDRGAVRPWVTHFNQTGEAFQQTLNARIDEGYRLVHVDMYSSDGTLLYASIFVQDAGPAWRVEFGRTIDRFNEIVDPFIENGFRIANLAMVEVDGTLFWTSLLDQEAVGRWVAIFGMTTDEYQTQIEAQRDDGLLLYYLSVYDLDGQPRFNAVWDERPYGMWRTVYDLSASGLQAEIDAAVGAGQYTRFVAGYRNGASANFSGLWTEE